MSEMDAGKKIVDVSIVAANFNNGPYLDPFIRSIDNSTVLPKELIIVDDGSTDNSIEILNLYKNLGYLRVKAFNGNRGFSEALNEGICCATGKYIMRADPDDEFLPERIETQFEYMEKHPSIDVLGCNVIYFNDKSGKFINISNFPINHKEIATTYLKGEHGIQHPTAVIRAEVMKKYKYGKDFPGEDYLLFATMIKDGRRFENDKTPLYKMRIHQNSSTSNLKLEGIRRTFQFRYQIFGKTTSKFRVWRYYLYIRNYRRYQLEETLHLRSFYLLLSALCYPKKLFKRLGHEIGIIG